MAPRGFSVIIATHNRVTLVGRAIESVLDQRWPELEIIVVDDASADGTGDYICNKYPQVKYIRQEMNQGPGPARNRGLGEASYNWAVILDDDDALGPEALKVIAKEIEGFQGIEKYPVLMFAHENGRLAGSFLLLRPVDYLRGAIQGDFVPVIQVPLFMQKGLAYPPLRIGGEHLLWMDVAGMYGIPCWDIRVARLYHDAPARLTSFAGQVLRAREYAELQDLTIQKFGDAMATYAPERLFLKYLGSAAYWLLAGNRKLCRSRLKKPLTSGRLSFASMATALWILSWMPQGIVRKLFLLYRKRWWGKRS